MATVPLSTQAVRTSEFGHLESCAGDGGVKTPVEHRYRDSSSHPETHKARQCKPDATRASLRPLERIDDFRSELPGLLSSRSRLVLHTPSPQPNMMQQGQKLASILRLTVAPDGLMKRLENSRIWRLRCLTMLLEALTRALAPRGTV